MECPLLGFSSKSLNSTDEHHCLHFEFSNMHLVSYCILINFVNTKWPDIFQFISCQLFINRLTIYVTRHEEIGLMCTKFTSSNYFTYFTFCVSYRSSVNCIKFSLMCSTNFESFIDKLNFGCKVVQPQSSKSGQILCAHQPYFLMLGHI